MEQGVMSGLKGGQGQVQTYKAMWCEYVDVAINASIKV